MTTEEINAMSLKELAEHLATLDLDWSLCLGAVTQFGRILSYSNGQILRSVGLTVEQEIFYCALRDRNKTQGWMRVSECRLILEDAATRGCLLAMVRAKHKNFYVRASQLRGFVPCNVEVNGLVIPFPGMITEAHAMVAAATKDPK